MVRSALQLDSMRTVDLSPSLLKILVIAIVNASGVHGAACAPLVEAMLRRKVPSADVLIDLVYLLIINTNILCFY
jgi:hypothetical protein